MGHYRDWCILLLSPQTLTSGHENCIVTVGGAAVQRRTCLARRAARDAQNAASRAPRAPPSGRCSVAAAGDRASERSRMPADHDVTVRRPGCTAGLERARIRGGTTHQRRRSARSPAIFSLPSMCQCRAIRHGRQK